MKTQKELAFLRELSVSADWTERFTKLFDENLRFSDEEKILYLNAGTGNHLLALREKLNKDTKLFAVCEDAELLKIAQAKAVSIKADIVFYEEIPTAKFDSVLANAGFVRSSELPEFIEKLVFLAKNDVAFFLPTAGSFGEVFSFLWEVLLTEDLLVFSENIENLISQIPTVSQLENTVKKLGLKNVETKTSNEIFEYENGKEFIASDLVSEFLLPVWLEFLDEKQKERVSQKLAQLIDTEDGKMTFRFSVKATLVSGKK